MCDWWTEKQQISVCQSLFAQLVNWALPHSQQTWLVSKAFFIKNLNIRTITWPCNSRLGDNGKWWGDRSLIGSSKRCSKYGTVLTTLKVDFQNGTLHHWKLPNQSCFLCRIIFEKPTWPYHQKADAQQQKHQISPDGAARLRVTTSTNSRAWVGWQSNVVQKRWTFA